MIIKEKVGDFIEFFKIENNRIKKYNITNIKDFILFFILLKNLKKQKILFSII